MTKSADGLTGWVVRRRRWVRSCLRDSISAVADDPVLEALDELVAVGRANVVAWMGVMERVAEVREMRLQGISYRNMSLSEGMSVVEAVAANQERLTAAGAKFRRAAVRQLQAEGLGAAAIARAFGVSRQRVASLLADEHAEDRPPA